MAYCKMHAITNSMSRALEYIENPAKTDSQLFVTGYGVQPYTASLEMEITKQLALDALGDRSVKGKANNLCYHLIQSFSPSDHLTPQQAHEIGQRLADELLGGRYEYVVATHTDKEHIHNHIIFNSTSFCDYRKFRSVPFQTIRAVNAISDRLCAEHNLSLSTLHRQQTIGFRYRPQQWEKHSSWRQEIRKRLRFVLETAESCEDFKEAAAALGITVNDSGQHVTYRMDGQERAVRDNTLDRDGAFTLKGIEQQIELSCQCRSWLKNALRTAAADVTDYRTFQKNLEAMDIRVKHLKSGTVYELPEGETVREWALGESYSTERLRAVIAGREEWQEDAPVTPEAVAESYAAYSRPPAVRVAVQVRREEIRGITPAGIFVNVPGQGSVFIDRRAVDMAQGAATATVYLLPSATYYAAENGSSTALRGEKLLRTLELAGGAVPVELVLGGELVCGLSPAGVSLSLPERGIQRLFIESDYMTCERTGELRVQLYPHWSYAFTDTNGQQRYITGDDLAVQISASQQEVTSSLIGRIGYLQRKQHLNAAKELAQVLTLLREEGIREAADIPLRLTQIGEQSALLRASMEKLEGKNGQYKAVARQLRIVQLTAPVQQEYERQLPQAKKKFRAQHRQELTAYDSATAELERVGVLPEVDPALVEELAERQAAELQRLRQELQQLSKRAQALSHAQEQVQRIQTPDAPQKPPQRRKEPQER